MVNLVGGGRGGKGVSGLVLILMNLIFQAARDGKIDLVRRRLEQLGKGHRRIKQQDIYNTTALHYAVRYNHIQVVQLLLDYGAGIYLTTLSTGFKKYDRLFVYIASY